MSYSFTPGIVYEFPTITVTMFIYLVLLSATPVSKPLQWCIKRIKAEIWTKCPGLKQSCPMMHTGKTQGQLYLAIAGEQLTWWTTIGFICVSWVEATWEQNGVTNEWPNQDLIHIECSCIFSVPQYLVSLVYFVYHK